MRDLSYARLLYGQTVCILGLGGIGRQVAVRARAFGMRVLGVKRNPQPVDGVERVVSPDQLDEVLPETQHLAITVPLTPETRGMIDSWPAGSGSCRAGPFCTTSAGARSSTRGFDPSPANGPLGRGQPRRLCGGAAARRASLLGHGQCPHYAPLGRRHAVGQQSRGGAFCRQLPPVCRRRAPAQRRRSRPRLLASRPRWFSMKAGG